MRTNFTTVTLSSAVASATSVALFAPSQLFAPIFKSSGVDAAVVANDSDGTNAAVINFVDDNIDDNMTMDDEDGVNPPPQFDSISKSRPPLQSALSMTPEAYRSDGVIDAMRSAEQAGNCTIEAVTNYDGSSEQSQPAKYCHIPFGAANPMIKVDEEGKTTTTTTIGVILYPGGSVDPRSYAPIASLLSERYGIPTVIPVFHNDLAMTFLTKDCGMERFRLAQLEFPNVTSWIFSGHSLGGTSASATLGKAIQTSSDDNNSTNYGLALLASYFSVDDIPRWCGNVDFSATSIPMTSVTGSNDEVITWDSWYEGQQYMSNATQWTDIYGGIHAQFGAYYDNSGTETPMISPEIQWDFTVASIASVAYRMGHTTIPKPIPNNAIEVYSSSSSPCAGYFSLFASLLSFVLAAAIISVV